MYGVDFTWRSLARVGARDRMWMPGIKVGSDKESAKVRKMAERDFLFLVTRATQSCQLVVRDCMC